MTFDQKLFV